MMNSDKKKILVICDYYLPGFKSGGGMRTIVNIVERLGGDDGRYDFSVITRDHDGRLDKSPYRTVKIGEWNQVGSAKVYYLSKDEISPAAIQRLVDEVSPDAIHLNSVFSTLANFLHFLRWRGKIKSPVIVSLCGELMADAMKMKRPKKRLYIIAARMIGLHKGLYWKPTNEPEKEDLKRELGQSERVYIAADMPPKAIFPDYDQSIKPRKTPGELKLVFINRFMPNKNFGFLLDVLKDVSGKISIDVIGELENQEYWQKCLEKIKQLPPRISVNYVGVIDHRLVPKKLAEYHFLVSPSKHENFGHIFPEALAAGCPLIISDKTPWRGLVEKGIGWDLSLESPESWAIALDQCVSMDDAAYRKLSTSARDFAVAWLADESLEKDTIRALEAALNAV